jgi:Uma2 family endonuclease
MAIADQRTTIQDFEAFVAKHPDKLFELIHGEIVEKMVTQEHGAIVVNIATEIRIYLKSNPIGVVGVEVSHRSLDDFNERLPDISFQKMSIDKIVKQGAVKMMPDLAVEVKSPTNTYKQLREKADFYLDNGCQLVWLVYPEKKLVEVYRNDADIDILTAEETLLGYDMLPDFELLVREIFPSINSHPTPATHSMP